MLLYLPTVGNESMSEIRKWIRIHVCDFVFLKNLSSRWPHKSKGSIPLASAEKECEL